MTCTKSNGACTNSSPQTVAYKQARTGCGILPCQGIKTMAASCLRHDLRGSISILRSAVSRPHEPFTCTIASEALPCVYHICHQRGSGTILCWYSPRTWQRHNNTSTFGSRHLVVTNSTSARQNKRTNYTLHTDHLHGPSVLISIGFRHGSTPISSPIVTH